MNAPNSYGFLPQPITLNDEQTYSIRVSLLTEHAYPDWMMRNNDGIFVYSQKTASQICDFDPVTDIYADDTVRMIDWTSTNCYSVLAHGLIKGLMAGNAIWRELDYDIRYTTTAGFLRNILAGIDIDPRNSDVGLLDTTDAYALRSLHVERMYKFRMLAGAISDAIHGAEGAVASVESDIVPDATVTDLFRTAAIVGIGAATKHRTAVDLQSMGLHVGIPVTDEAIRAAFG